MSSRKSIPLINLDTARLIIDRTLEGSRYKDIRPVDSVVKGFIDEVIGNYDARLFIHSMADFSVWERNFRAISKVALSLRQKISALEDESPLFHFFIQSVIYSDQPVEQTEAVEYIEKFIYHLSILERYLATALDAVSAERKSGAKRWYEMSESPEVWLMQEAIPELYEKIFKRDYSAGETVTSPSQRFASVLLEVLQARRSPDTIRSHNKERRRKALSRAQTKS